MGRVHPTHHVDVLDSDQEIGPDPRATVKGKIEMTIGNSSRAIVLAMLATICTAAAAGPYDIPAKVEATAKAQINAATLEAPIRFLASDALEGRGPATRGD